MGIYGRFRNILRPPILLCEVIRRCAWYSTIHLLAVENSLTHAYRAADFFLPGF